MSLAERSGNRLGGGKLRLIDLTGKPGPGKTLRKADDLCAPLDRNPAELQRSFQIRTRVGSTPHLDPRHRQHAAPLLLILRLAERPAHTDATLQRSPDHRSPPLFPPGQ